MRFLCILGGRNIARTLTENHLLRTITTLQKYKNAKTKYRGDKSGKSFKSTIVFSDKKDNHINIICYDFSEDMPWVDTLSVAIISGEFMDWNKEKGFK